MTDVIDFAVPNLEANFYNEIENTVQSSNISYMDAIIGWCEKRNIEVEYVSGFVVKNLVLRAKLQSEAEDLHFIKRTKRLPI